MDMLPAHKTASSTSSLSIDQDQHMERPAMPQSSTLVELQAKNPRIPEMDAEAPGPHVLEAETVETIVEMYSQAPVGELEGQSSYAMAV